MAYAGAEWGLHHHCETLALRYSSHTSPARRHHPCTARRRYSAADYRDRLYREISRRKKEAKDARAAREATLGPEGGSGGGGAPQPMAH